MSAHLPTCRVRTEVVAGEYVTHSEPDNACTHESHVS
jgi:hypothetical protein